MRKYKQMHLLRYVLKTATFLLLLLWMIDIGNQVFVIKNVKVNPNVNNKTSDYLLNRLDGFYAEQPNTLDVLFFGGSRLHCGISPMKMYEMYGFKSYDVSADQQTMPGRYQYMKEAFRYQKPQVVVLDLNSLGGGKLIGDQAHYSYDFMHFSIHKIISVLTTVEPQYWLDVLCPLVGSHTRWKELTYKDVAYLKDQQPSVLGGFFGYLTSEPMQMPSQTEQIRKKELTKEHIKWLDKAVDLCERKGVKLIFTLLPTGRDFEMRFAYNDALTDYAEKRNITYIDYSYLGGGTEVGIDYATDFSDPAHLNLLGAEKISGHLGGIIDSYLDKEKFASATDQKWMERLALYHKKTAECRLAMTGRTEWKNYKEYMAQVNANPDWAALVIGVADLHYTLDFEGYKSDLSGNWNYLGILKTGDLTEKTTMKEPIEQKIQLGKNLYHVCIDSARWTASVMLNEESCMDCYRGLNVLVVDTSSGEIVDTKNFDIYYYAYLESLN